jgi:hypothetical protein
MRILKKLAVFSIASLITFGLGMTVHRVGPAATRYISEQAAWQVLLSFQNQDLGGLDEPSTRAVKRAVDKATGQGRPPQFVEFEPRLFRKISNSNGEPRYILVEEAPLVFTPGTATIRVHIFDTAGKLLSNTQFETGNKMAIISLQIRNDYWLKSDTLMLDSEFWLGGGSSHHVYAIVGNELRLAYLSDGVEVQANDYQAIGPRLNLSADEWDADLQSTDNARLLSALTLLRGSHWNRQEPPNDEDRPNREKVIALRGRESVRRRLADLTNSDNYIIKNTAEAIVKDK